MSDERVSLYQIKYRHRSTCAMFVYIWSSIVIEVLVETLFPKGTHRFRRMLCFTCFEMPGMAMSGG